MNQQKTSSKAFLGFRHFLIGGLIIPIVFSFVIGLLGGVIFHQPQPPAYFVYIIEIVALIGLWLGVFYSAKNIMQTYTGVETNKVINIATIWFAIFILIWTLFSAGALIFNLVNWAIQTIVFYFLSKKYFAIYGYTKPATI